MQIGYKIQPHHKYLQFEYYGQITDNALFEAASTIKHRKTNK